jgi:hypothetical protein
MSSSAEAAPRYVIRIQSCYTQHKTAMPREFRQCRSMGALLAYGTRFSRDFNKQQAVDVSSTLTLLMDCCIFEGPGNYTL